MTRPPEPEWGGYRWHEHDSLEDYPRISDIAQYACVGALLVIVFAVFVLLLIGALHHPAPVISDPTPVVYDSGFHKAIDAYGSEYRIDLSYGSMNDAQRDDANRFAHEHPDGE